ncbi:MAG: hypothetical protein QOF48_3642 [Verrucomicrobiota bacterium]|jgi:uncharacterized protein (DUF1800 family)
MNARRFTFPLFPLAAAIWLGPWVAAADNFTDPPAPSLGVSTLSNGQRRVTFGPYPAGNIFRMLRKSSLGDPWLEDLTGAFSNLTWTAPAVASNVFHQLEVTPLSSNALLTTTVLSKLAYGPTPELLDRLATVGADVYIHEQLNPETIVERAATAAPAINSLMATFGSPTTVIPSGNNATGPGTADIHDLRAWLVLNAVNADRQLHEILTQFFENHFVTEFGKSANYFIGRQYGQSAPDRLAADFEWREVNRWRQVLLSTNGTFLDMLRISAESPAMIIYLDTYTSRANGANIPNENYSRELMELFTMGVDNGYDQGDITNMAPCWTGWTFEIVATNNAGNPFATQSTTQIAPGSLNPTAVTNLLGAWALNYRVNAHATYSKRIFAGKMVPARFGLPYTTKLYGGNITPGLYQLDIPARTGTNGFADGYDVVNHLASLPFTQEFISVKLCRLLVHDGFQIGYDFTDPALSEEGRLVKACMAAWENGNPKGQIRAILATIFNSSLFRGPGGNAHKVKTPLEFCVSAIRALRQSTNGTGAFGSFTAATDGYGVVYSSGARQVQGNNSPLMRQGGMSLFNRDAPDGYAEAGDNWVNAGALAERIRFVQTLLMAGSDTNKNDANTALLNNTTDPVSLVRKRLPLVADQKDAAKVADLFLGLLYPGEGRASLGVYRTIALDFLNTADDGIASSPFTNLTPSNAAGAAYDTRLRGLASMLLTLQRFQEQ